MQTIEAKKRRINPSEFAYKPVPEPLGFDRIEGNAEIVMDGKPVITQRILTRNLGNLKDALGRISYKRTFRSRGLPSTSRVFGYLPRLTIRRDFCTASAMAVENPREHSVICNQARLIDPYYRKANPAGYKRHKAMVEEMVLPDWRLPGSVFTSGIANHNNPLRYHYDAGNFKGVWSAMLVAREGVDGGGLAIPELGLCFAVPDNSLLMFNGQELLHGVTPIEGTDSGGHRYSVVFYSFEQMWRCDPLSQELDRIRNQKTAREQARVTGESLVVIKKRWKVEDEATGFTSNKPHV